MQPSVTEQPYFSCDRSLGIGWLPPTMFDSIITPTSDWLPCLICWITSDMTSGCSSGFL